MPESIIDLGELPPGEQVPGERVPPPPPPGRLRGMLVAVVAVLLTLTSSSAGQRPALPAFTVIPASPGDVTFREGNDYFVVAATFPAFNGQVENKIINWYALPSARLRSRTSVAVTGAIRQVTAVQGLVVASYEVDGSGRFATVGVTAGTGSTRWRHYGRLAGSSAAGRVVLTTATPGSDAATPGPDAATWYGVDAGTGDISWRYERGPAGAVGLSAPADGTSGPLITVTAQGVVAVRDVDTGTVTATAPAPADVPGSRRDLAVVDGLVLVGGSAGMTAYALPDLRARWRSEANLSDSRVQRCGAVICLLDRLGGIRALDPTTGRQRWAAAGWTSAAAVGAYLLVGGPEPATGPAVVLDGRNGRRLGDVAAWRPLGASRPDDTIPVVRESVGDRRTWYGVLDPRTRAVRVLGAAQLTSGDCQSTADVLVCRRSDASAGVWQLGA